MYQQNEYQNACDCLYLHKKAMPIKLWKFVS
jgi:hypothetical protein